jgi:hypothetical protein
MAKAIITRTYQDHAISYDATGWFNATQAAAKFGKSPYEWQRLPDTVAYVAALERKYGKIPYSKSKRGAGGGTWLHPKLAVNFARWLDVDFAIWCDEQIDSIVRGKDDWRKLRHAAASSNIVLNGIIQEARAEAGKETGAVHYMSEAKLVNWAAFGKFAGVERDGLTREQLDLLAHLETRNGVMIGRGLSYDERKARLPEISETWQERRIAKMALKHTKP